MQQYEYQPLHGPKHVRILKLSGPSASASASTLDDGLVAELEHICLDDAGKLQYEPVSYVWTGTDVIDVGDPAAEVASRRNKPLATADGRVLMVTESLYSALPYLWRACRTGRLWIDQLCINQDNHQERGQQVAIMHEIFAHGARTLIFLDGEHEHAAYVRRVADVAESLSDSPSWSVPWADMSQDQLEGLGGREAIVANLEPVMLRIWTRAWWRRIWVLQEAYHSNNRIYFAFGDVVLTKRNLLQVEGALDHFRSPDFVACHKQWLWARTARTGRATVEGVGLLGAGGSGVNFEHDLGAYASDARDLVYALLTARENPRLPTPDYTVSAARVYAETTRAHSNTSQRLNALYVCSGAFPFLDRHDWTADVGFRSQLPSWAIDYSRSHTMDMFPVSLLYPHYKLSKSVCGGLKHLIADQSEWNVLKVAGMRIDEIVQVAPAAAEKTRWSSERYQQYDDAMHTAGWGFDHDVEDQWDVDRFPDVSAVMHDFIAAVLTEGCIARQALRDQRSSSPVYYPHFAGTVIPLTLEPVADQPQDTDIVPRLQQRVAPLAAFRCKTGRLGMASASINLGDDVAIVHGLASPAVLRRVPDTEQYSVLGVCYAEDTMQGEGVTWAEEEAEVIELV